MSDLLLEQKCQNRRRNLRDFTFRISCKSIFFVLNIKNICVSHIE